MYKPLWPVISDDPVSCQSRRCADKYHLIPSLPSSANITHTQNFQPNYSLSAYKNK